MKIGIFRAFMGLLCLPLFGQSLSNALIYNQTSFEGSARFTSMGGAYTAIGGDLNAMTINPAGSSIFAFSELGLSINTVNSDLESSYFGSQLQSTNEKFSIDQFGLVFVLKETQIEGWSKISFGFNYQKTHNFKVGYKASGYNPNNGLDNYFLHYADGLFLDTISQLDGEDFDQAYTDIGQTENLGFAAQQALFGYEGYVISPIPLESDPENFNNANIQNYSSNTLPAGNGYFHEFHNDMRGSANKYTFNMSAAYNNKFYIGLNINTHKIEHRQSLDFFESNYATDSFIQAMRFNNQLVTTADGLSFNFGMIYKLNSNLRLGMSYESPTYYTVFEEIRQFLVNEDIDGVVLELNPKIDLLFPEYNLKTAGILRTGITYIFSDKAILSADFSSKSNQNIRFDPREDSFLAELNQKAENQLQTSNILQIGGELRVTPQLSLRVGYIEESASRKDFDNGYSMQTAGFGYSFGSKNLDFSIRRGTLSDSQKVFDAGFTDSIRINSEKTQFSLTYRVKL